MAQTWKPQSSLAGSISVRSSAVVELFKAAQGLLLGKAPENRSDLADHLCIDSVSKPQRTVGPVGMRMNDENALLQSAVATQKTAVSFEKNIERLFPRCPGC